ncbi:MAG: cupin domain-containing protein [Vicinamibacteraceae bacterium]|nr:cupin domain-containing protein [Vicinamibacteraceae bacterium]
MAPTVAAVETLERVRFGAGGGIYHVVATAAETGNTIYAFEATEPPGGGPPLHTHAGEEEFFLVLEGEVSFYVGGQAISGGPGTSAFAPRGVPHCFKNTSTRDARLLVLFTPAAIEGFFNEYGAADEDGGAPPNEILLRRIEEVGPRYGLEVLGPSPL